MNHEKLCAFDFDSTLMDGETIDILGAAAGTGAEISAITEAAMRGELDFFEALTSRVLLLKGLKYERVQGLCRTLPLMPGAPEAIRDLKQKGYRVVIFSGGFREATRHHAEVLGADADFANFLHVKDGALSGLVGGEMMTSDAKGQMLTRLQNLLNVSKENTIAVGDGANDLSLFEHAGRKIAFCAKAVLKEAADYVVDVKYVREVSKGL
ncbi:phosphoserine phosphatase SerB [soil metagenome]